MSQPFDTLTRDQLALIKAERLAAILQMITGLSHESRNAMQRAQACLELLELELGGGHEQLRLTDRIRQALADLHQNYEDVKDYAAPINLNRQPTDLHQLCQSAFDELTSSLPMVRCRLRFTSPEVDSKVLVDPARMKVVFRNLLDNAIAASPNGSPIEVSSVRIFRNDQQSLRLAIRDHGSGLMEPIQAELFEPFVTTKQHGTGLGLAVCWRIIESHGGIITAGDHVDGGAMFSMLLPADAVTPRSTQTFGSC